MPQFRNIKERDYATLAVDDDIPLAGTWNLLTCVGVYFKVDDARWFLAHINAVSSVTYAYNVVTSEGARWIASKTKEKLIELKDSNKWDVKHEMFGRDLHIQCQCNADMECGDGSYLRSGRFIICAIREFFDECAKTLTKEVQNRRNAVTRALRKSHPEKGKAYDSKTAHLENRAAALASLGTDTAVVESDHGFVVDPRSGMVTLLKGSTPSSEKEFGGYIPIIQPIQKGEFFLLLEDDDPDAFPKSLINTKLGDEIADYQFATAHRQRQSVGRQPVPRPKKKD